MYRSRNKDEKREWINISCVGRRSFMSIYLVVYISTSSAYTRNLDVAFLGRWLWRIYSIMSLFCHVEHTQGPNRGFLDTLKGPWFWMAVEQLHAWFEQLLRSSKVSSVRPTRDFIRPAVFLWSGFTSTPLCFFRCFLRTNLPFWLRYQLHKWLV